MVEYLTPTSRRLILVIRLLIITLFSSIPALGQETDFTIITVNEVGEPANRWTSQADISWNGEFVVWASPADNLVGDDQYDGSDIFLRDKNGLISLISVNSHGIQSNGWSFDPTISANSRYIAFSSIANNLQSKYAHPDTNGLADIYLHDRNRYTTERISVSKSGQQITGWSCEPSISSDGRFIVYTSSADDIIAGDDNHVNDIYLYDHQTKDVRIISRSPENQSANGPSSKPSISSTGRFIAFISQATNLSSDAKPGIFFYDQVDRNLVKVPLDLDAMGHHADPRISKLALSGDGNILFFSILVGTANTIFGYEYINHKLEPIFSSSSEQEYNIHPTPVDISNGGRYVVYPGKQQGGSQTLHVYELATTDIEEIAIDNHIENDSVVIALQVSPDGSNILIQRARYSLNHTLPSNIELNDLYLAQTDSIDITTSQLIGWVSDGLGFPISGVSILMEEDRMAKTDQSGNFIIAGLSPGFHTLEPSKEGYVFEPDHVRLASTNPLASPPMNIGFIAVPAGVVEAARQDIGMPYSLSRGCETPFTPCGGPFHGYFSGDCTDLIIDAYRYGADFHIGRALEWDVRINPRHYYRWRDVRNSHDMWRYFAYTNQILSHDQNYLPGDIVFFDWDRDGISDHVALVSEINRKYRPVRIIDATGYIEENPEGLAIEMDWKPYHNAYAQAHARWNGASSTRLADEQEGNTFILIALDSPAATLQVINAAGKITNMLTEGIPQSQYWKYGSNTVISILVPQSSTQFYRIELSSPVDDDFHMGIQTIQDKKITQNYSYSSGLSAGQELIIPLEMINQDGQFGFMQPVILQD